MPVIGRLVNLSPIVQIRCPFSSTFCTPIRNPSAFNVTNDTQLLPGYSLI
nr:MAG TPA: hypothetical protein [Caudoviricetes sp.]